MFKNFTPEYKGYLLTAENSAKQQSFSSLESVDIVMEILRSKKWHVFAIFNDFGINEKVFLDVMTHPKFAPLVNRSGEYTGISELLRNIIVASVKVAASFEKKNIGIEDFLLALIKQSNSWFLDFLDFIRINVRDFEWALIDLNRSQTGTTGGTPDLGKIMNVLEQWLLSGVAMEDVDQNPVFAQMNNSQDQNQKRQDSQTPALDFFCTDITKEAAEGKIDPIIGREKEIDRLISILNRKTKNNPVLTGDPGVGKTAVVEWLARRISEGTVPFAMQHKRLLVLDMTSLVAGTKYRGEFEIRMKQVIEEATKLENEVILFIDEIHTIIGAGGSEGMLDAANILKPAMGRWKIRIIGATTLSEYQKYIEKDAALERRFQKIEVDEPSKEVAAEIIRWLRGTFEDYHNLIINDDAIDEAVELSVRYMTERFLPDKAIDLIDEACSAKSMTYVHGEDEIKTLKLEAETLQKNITDFVTSQQYHKASRAKDQLMEIENTIREKRRKITIPREKRHHIQSADIQKVVHDITGVPMKTLSAEDIKKLQDLEKHMGAKIIGQDTAIKSIVSTIKRSQAGISDQRRPLGSFLFLWPTGVGKTELVKVLAREYYGDEKALIKIDMSEFSERHSGSKLIGTTAGFVGFEEGGMLTEKVRRKPYSVVLFDEIEKGNPEIFNLLLQIMEDGAISDGKGRKVNFKNTIIVMTSNIGSEEFATTAAKIGFDVTEATKDRIIDDFEQIEEKVVKSLDEYFSPEFINRIDKVVVFKPLDTKVIKKIITLQLAELQKRLVNLGVTLEWAAPVVDRILKDTYNPEFGARPVRRYIQTKIEDEIADRMIGKKVTSVKVTNAKKEGFDFTVA
jgi:ATP-dependent Clp protease ATP-binding subunit ClpC